MNQSQSKEPEVDEPASIQVPCWEKEYWPQAYKFSFSESRFGFFRNGLEILGSEHVIKQRQPV